jgi:hypothetical protein
VPTSAAPVFAQPPTARTTATATSSAESAPSVPADRGLALAFLGGLLAAGLAVASTSSAAGGGHAPSSSTAVTTRPFRLVAPVLRWRLRALAERVRPAPLVFPLELPG